jgi:hypothetical protein
VIARLNISRLPTDSCFLRAAAVFLTAVTFSALASPATAARIFNGAKNLDMPELLPHRSVNMRALWPGDGEQVDFGEIDEAHVRQFVASLPNDRTYEFDLEGNPAREDLNLHLWYYETRPDTSVALRERMMSIVANERPDLDAGIWSIPDNTHVLQRQPGNRALALAIVQREIAYQAVTRYSDTIYISGYWRYRNPADLSQLDQWKKEIRLKVNLAETFHGQRPRVYIWHRGYLLRDKTLSPELFRAMLEFLRQEELDAIFWAQQSDRYFPDWLIDLLAEYHLKE